MTSKINYTIPEVKGVYQNNKIFRANEKKGIPFLAIHKAIKYGYISYDFIALDHGLKPEAVNEIEVIFHEMALNPYIDNRKKWFGVGSISGHSVGLRLDLCREYALIIKDIIMNKDKWRPHEYLLPAALRR